MNKKIFIMNKMLGQPIVEELIENLKLRELIVFWIGSKNLINDGTKSLIENHIKKELKTLGLSTLKDLKMKYPLKIWINEEIERRIAQNSLIELLEKYPNEAWDWYEIAINPNITLDYVLANWREEFQEFFSGNSNLKLKDLTNQHFLDWGELSCHPAITVDFIMNNKDKPWDMTRVSQNKNITTYDLIKYPKLKRRLSHKSLSWNKNMTFQFVLANMDWNWDWAGLSCNLKLTIQDILNHPELPWSKSFLSLNNNFTREDILNHPEIGWKNLSKNRNFSREDKINYPYLDWGFCFNLNLDISLKDVLKNSYYTIDLYRHPGFVPVELLAHKKLIKNNCLYFFNLNPNINSDNISTIPELNWEGLSRNHFTKDEDWLKLAHQILNF